MNRNEKNVNKLTMLGMMTALVFVSNYLRITMPIAIGGRTSFTLANIMCCLSGLLLGPVGGFASGLGSAIYDLTNLPPQGRYGYGIRSVHEGPGDACLRALHRLCGSGLRGLLHSLFLQVLCV